MDAENRDEAQIEARAERNYYRRLALSKRPCPYPHPHPVRILLSSAIMTLVLTHLRTCWVYPTTKEKLLTSMLNSKAFAEEYRLRCEYEKTLFDSTKVLSNNGGIRSEEFDDIREALDRGPQQPLPKNDQEFAADDLHR